MEIIKELTTEILVAILIAVSIFIFNKFLRPFTLGVLQRTPDVTGAWTGFDINEHGQEQQLSRMEIRQLGTNITATIIRQTANGGERIFKYHGTISSGQVLLIWKEEIGNGYNMGTLTLLLSGNLQQLKGKTTFNHHDEGKIISQERVYRKVNG